MGAVFDSSAETISASQMTQTVGFLVRQVFVAERVQGSQLKQDSTVSGPYIGKTRLFEISVTLNSIKCAVCCD